MRAKLGYVVVWGSLAAAGCSSTAPGTSATTPSTPDRGPGRSGADASSPGMLSDGCPTNSGFPGDDLCLAPPAPDKGFQLHYGPSDYADPANVAPYVLAPNKETVDCDYMKTPNSKDMYVSGYEFYMRQGSHHLIANVNPMAQADGFGTCQTNDMTPGLLGGSQTPKVDELEDPAPENQGLAVHVPANSQAVINFHVINTGVTPILREAWLNYFYIDASQVKGIRGNVFLTGGLGFHHAGYLADVHVLLQSGPSGPRPLAHGAHACARDATQRVEGFGKPTVSGVRGVRLGGARIPSLRQRAYERAVEPGDADPGRKLGPHLPRAGRFAPVGVRRGQYE